MNGARHVMRFGAEPLAAGGVRFGLWAPDAKRVDLCLQDDGNEQALPMQTEDNGWYGLTVDSAGPDTLYRYRIEGRQQVPDPASRFQPRGVHGPSQVVDALGYDWRERDWRGRPWREAVLYELHVGTFTAEGTFHAAAERCAALAELGVTAIEIMPVATFPGQHNWGYDGVLPYAPFAGYGTPDDLRALVDAAHAAGLMVLIDVVYNHFGPEGNYLHLYARRFFTDRHHTPWGDAINYDGADSRPVREFFIHNALYWLEEFRVDGLRLDAVHAIRDDSRPDILEELAAVVDAGPGRERRVHLVLENVRNEARRLDPRLGSHYRAQWNDDFHHACHVLLTGEQDGYYADYSPRPVEHLARCLLEGFAYQGEVSRFRRGARRGEPSGELPYSAFVNFLQNHDQVGNRAYGERLTTLVSEAALKAAVSVLLLAPSVPGLFMGEEFGCVAPFLYFTDFEGALAAAVRTGRQREFTGFAAFAGEAADLRIPDPNDPETFSRSKIAEVDLDAPSHRAWLELYRELLGVRHRELVPHLDGTVGESSAVLGHGALCVAWRLGDGRRLTLTANLHADERHLPARWQPPRGALLARIGWNDEPWTGPSRLPPWSTVWQLEKVDSRGEART